MMGYDIRARLLRLWSDEGGWITAALAGAGLLGKLVSGGAKGSADSREAQNQRTVYQDKTRQDALAAEERALQERAKLEMEQRAMDAQSRESGYKQAMRAQYLQGWQPAQRPDGVQTVRGGFNTIPQASRDLAKDFERQALIKALQGEKFDALPAIERFKASEMKEPSLWEKMSGALGLGLQGAGAIYGALGKGKGGDPAPWLGDFGGYE